jgi:glycosyltransferase involved in cell wall biosynthesis
MIPAQQKVAIVIPYYKNKFFDETLQSLSKQSDKNFTVYIGDDGSPECPTELISRYQNQLRINYKRFDENLGRTSLVSHWHRCLDMMADEEWVMILGDDDFLNPNCVEELLKAIGSSDGATSVYRFATEVIDERSGVTRGPFNGPDKESCVDFIERKFLEGARSSLSEYVFRADLLKAKRFRDYPLAWFADVMAVIEVSEGYWIAGINDACVGFRISLISISGNGESLAEKSLAAVMHRRDLLTKFGERFSKSLTRKLVKSLETYLVKTGMYSSSDLYLFVRLYFRSAMFFEVINLSRRLPQLLRNNRKKLELGV